MKDQQGLMHTADLFAESVFKDCDEILPDVFLLKGFALQQAPQLITAIGQINAQSTFRKMQTPGGFYMSAAITNCGDVGWHTDRQGYRYTAIDPLTNLPWPECRNVFVSLLKPRLRFVAFLTLILMFV